MITLARKKGLIVGVSYEPRIAWVGVHAMHQAGAMLCRAWNVETSRSCTELLHLGEVTTVMRDVNDHQGRVRLQQSLAIDVPAHCAPSSSAAKRAPSPAERGTWAATPLQPDSLQPDTRTERAHASSFSLIS